MTLVRGTVKLKECRIYAALVGGIETFKKLCDGTIDIRDGVPMELATSRNGTSTVVKSRTKGLIALLGACFPSSRPVADIAVLVNEIVGEYAETTIRHEDIVDDLLLLAESEALDLLTEARPEPMPPAAEPTPSWPNMS